MSVLLTHVPKTAGTSIRKSVFDHVVEDKDIHRFTGVRAALKHGKPFKLLVGHYPYGVHWLYSMVSLQYFVMLREPVDRAVSHYYFIQSCDTDSYQHPRLQDVKSRSLVGLYEMPEYQNMQTLFIAGLPWQLIGRQLSLNNVLGKYVLGLAKKNLLGGYQAFGLKERFDESAQLFASHVNTRPETQERKHKRTPDRPSVADLDASVIQSIRANNTLDVALYEFAVTRFEDQF